MFENEKSFDEAWEEALAESPEATQEKNQVKPEVAEKPDTRESSQNNEEDSSEGSSEHQETDFEILYKREVQKTKSWEGRIRKANELRAEAEEETARLREEIQQLREQPKKETPPADDSVELDNATLEAFVREFPELQAPLAALVRKEAKALVAEEIGQFKPTVEKMQKSEADRVAAAQKAVVEEHFRTIRNAHKDFDALIEKGTLREWIDTQPPLFQKAFIQVYESGTAEEVIAMVDHMKSDLDLQSPSTIKTGDKRDKLRSLMAVRGSAPIVPKETKASKDDYDAAWEEANKKTR